MVNVFKYSSSNFKPLNSGNPRHIQAMKHTMMLYKSNALYTFIPKNACSTMRLSVAKANGCITSENQSDWIHANNGTFNASLGEAVKAEYSFVILRCPFRRLASVFLDKFVGKYPPAWQLRDEANRTLELNNLTFREFVTYLRRPAILNLNIHWRPQVDFLLYEDYSEYFSLENFASATARLKEKINLDLIDARSLTKHGLDQYKLVEEECYADTEAFDIAIMQRSGLTPSHIAMYDKELYQAVAEIYAPDIEFYKSKFSPEEIMHLP